MTAFKQLKTSDILVTPFNVSKHFTFLGGHALEDKETGGINRFFIKVDNHSSRLAMEPVFYNGRIWREYDWLVWNSIKHLFYSNYQNSSFGDEPLSGSLIPGVTEEDLRYEGGTSSQGRYFNYPQTSLTFDKGFFHREDYPMLGVISIPKKLYGEKIFPNTFECRWTRYQIKDDGEGNLFFGTHLCGNIFYAQGIAVIFWDNISGIELDDFMGQDFDCSFSSSLTIYETQYKCTLNDSEFNLSLNPSLTTSSFDESGGEYLDFATGSDFNPYITTVGLYNDEQELLAVTKLSFPVPSSKFNDTTIMINLDQ